MKRTLLTLAVSVGSLVSCSPVELDLGSQESTSNPSSPSADRLPMALGGRHACAAVDAKRVKCWGENDFGQVGLTPSESHLDCGGVPCQELPNTISLKSPASSVDAGRKHSCILGSDGVVWCFGGNQWGQLGRKLFDGDAHAIPERVLLSSKVDAIALGAFHSCVLTAGKLFCFGLGASGQLGVPPTDLDSCGTDDELANELSLPSGALPCSPSPLEVKLGGAVEAVVAGTFSTCAKVAGEWRCFGDNRRGELGRGFVSPFEWEAGKPDFSDSISDLAMGGHVLCITSPDGLLSCAGDNGWGQLGSGSAKSEDCSTGLCRATLLPVSQIDNVLASAVAAGTTCALIQDGTIQCFGSDLSGELGNSEMQVEECNGTACSRTPVAVYGLTNKTQLHAGDDFFCTRDSSSKIDCWGNGEMAQLTGASRMSASQPGEAYGLASIPHSTLR